MFSGNCRVRLPLLIEQGAQGIRVPFNFPATNRPISMPFRLSPSLTKGPPGAGGGEGARAHVSDRALSPNSSQERRFLSAASPTSPRDSVQPRQREIDRERFSPGICAREQDGATVEASTAAAVEQVPMAS